MRRRKSWAAIGLAVASLALAGGGVAWGEGGGERSKPPSADSVTLHDKTIDVTEALAAHYDRAGFASVSVDEDRHIVTIRWAGDIPADIKERAGDHNGVQVEVIPARYSAELLSSAGRKLMEANRNFAVEQIAGSDEVVPGVRGVAPTDDRSGLVVELSPAADKQRQSLSLEGLTDSERSIPLSYQVDDSPAVNLALGRQNDPAPWQAGGVMNRGGTLACSTGFAVLGPAGGGRLLSAGHCENVGDTVNDGNGDVIGPATGKKLAYDSRSAPRAPIRVNTAI